MIILLQIIIGLLILGILVLVHELGHFWAAKTLKIRVLAFSIGFGKPLWKKTIGETEYRLCSIPFGGYVNMAGEHPETENDTPLQPGDFNAKPTWQRAIVAIAGPAANLVFAMTLLWIVFMVGVQSPVYLKRPVIGAVADSSAAHQAGLKAGDSIITINNHRMSTWEDVQTAISAARNSATIQFQRGSSIDSTILEIPPITGRGIPRQPTAGLLAPLPAIIGALTPGSPAEKAGMQKGDTVTAISETPIHSWFQLSGIISHFDSLRGPLRFSIRRSGSFLSISIVPQFNKQAGRYLIGAGGAAPQTTVTRYSLTGSLRRMLQKTAEYTFMIYDVVVKLVSRQVSPQQLAGPIGIVQMSGVMAMGGPAAILDFMALLGITLAVLNLLPLVITDGGLLLFLLIETIRRKPLALRHQLVINRVAIAFFIALFVYVTINDIARIPELLRFAK